MGQDKSHAMERRTREVGDMFCIEPGCDYEGQPAVQGHCHTRLDDETDKYLREKEQGAMSILAHAREHNPDPAEYVKTLESLYICAWTNSEFMLDELVRLRRDNAALRRTAAMSPEAAPRG